MAMNAPRAEKRAGDISDAFASLAGDGTEPPLDARFATLKKELLHGREEAIVASWNRLLEHLREEIAIVREKGSSLIPEISYNDVKNGKVSQSFRSSYEKTGACVVRGVVSPSEALGYKSSIRDYVKQNPQTKAFPPHDPQVYELYWSPAQVKARSHPNMLGTQKFLMSFWHAHPQSKISLRHPVAYADRLRIRQPGDASFALGPHIDGGSLERWEYDGYAKAQTYDRILEGRWEDFDPWDASKRVGAVMALYEGVGNCSALRLGQGWLGMSEMRGGEGHLMVNPVLKGATAYLLLRPFFEAKRSLEQVGEEEYLHKSNWKLEDVTSVSSMFPLPTKQKKDSADKTKTHSHASKAPPQATANPSIQHYTRTSPWPKV